MDNHRHLTIFSLIIGVLLAIYPSYGIAGARVSSYEEKLLLHINQHRIEKGLNPLAMDKSLSRLAERHSIHMEEKNLLSHEGFQERFRQSDRSLCVENVGWNYRTPEDQFRAWKKSGEHNKNLLNKKIIHAGIARTGTYITFLACTEKE